MSDSRWLVPIMMMMSLIFASPPQLSAQEGPTKEPAGEAQPTSNQKNLFDLSDLEWRLVQKMMAKHGLEAISRAKATGKTIETIIVETEEVFTPEDFFPDFLNLLHTTSRKSVIRREVLQTPGEAFDPMLAAQSERNLRGPLTLSIALVLPMRGSRPDSTRLLVVTKDLWSLRASANFQVVGDTLDFLSLSLSESNIAGTHKFAALTMLLRPNSIRLGEIYVDPRLFGSRLQLSESISVPLNIETGSPEGLTAVVSLAKPLFSLRSRWGYELKLTAHTAVGRSFVGGELRQIPVAADPTIKVEGLGRAVLRDPREGLREANPRDFSAFDSFRPDQLLMPFNWRERIFEAQVATTRSYGREVKQNISAGYEIGVQRFSFGVDDEERSQFSARQITLFEENLLPRSEFVGAVFASYRVFTPDFISLRNFETLALPEDFRFGPSLQLSAKHADPLLGSEVRFDAFSIQFVERWFFGAQRGENLAKAADILIFDARASTRLQGGELKDRTLRLVVRNYTPVIAGGRLVIRGTLLHRKDDETNSLSTFGGGSGLRGFEIGQFIGRSSVTSNVEWRTMPVELFTLQFGAVAFLDSAGISSEEDLSNLDFFHSVGLGGRLVNTISNRIVMRLDWGVPLNDPLQTGFPGRLSFGFEQAF